MTIDIVKYIVFAIAVSILYGVIGHLNRKKNAISGKIQSDAQYIVTLPSALKYVYMAMFLLGVALFFIFLAFKVISFLPAVSYKIMAPFLPISTLPTSCMDSSAFL